MKTINYKGKTLETIHWRAMSDELHEQLKKQYYEKPSFELVKREFINLKMGKVKYTNIERYYFRELMSKVVLHHSKWSIEDVFNYKELLESFYDKTFKNEKVYPQDKPLISNVETSFRLGGKGVASKPSNFPIKHADEILKLYNVNDNYYDPSCGWGVRLMSALRNDVNYYGTDPNYLLVDQLKTLAHDYKKVNGDNDKTVDIRPTGSECFQEDWVGKMGLCFTSPPYFNLEDYKIGSQSWNEGVSYEAWLTQFLKPTIENTKEYLIEGGYLAININNFGQFNLVEDVKEIALSLGFSYVTTHTLENIKRVKSNGGFNDNSEGIMVFQK